MIKDTLLQERIQFYLKQVRCQELRQIKANYRMQYMHNSTLAQVQSFLQSPKESQQITPELWSRCEAVLIQPFPEKAQLRTIVARIPIERHVVFWHNFLNFYQNNPMISERLVPCMTEFLVALKGRYEWSQVQVHSEYGGVILSVIEAVIPFLKKKTRKQMVQWLDSFKCLEVVKSLLLSLDSFASPDQFPRLYRLILNGLSSSSLEEQSMAAQLITQVVRFASPAKNYLLFKKKSLLFEKLLELIWKYVTKKEVTHFWAPLLYLIQTQSPALCQYASSGLIRACGQLLDSNFQSNLFGALSILNVFSSSEHQEILRQLIGKETKTQNFWLNVCIKKRIFLSDKIEIRTLFFEVLRNVLYNWDKRDLKQINEQWQFSQLIILDIAIPVWEVSQRDQKTLISTLSCVQWLLLPDYSDDDQLEEFQTIAAQIHSRGMVSFLQKCSESANLKISDPSCFILDRLQSITKDNRVPEL